MAPGRPAVEDKAQSDAKNLYHFPRLALNGLRLAYSIFDTGPRNFFTPVYQLELEPIQTQMTQKPVLRAEVGMRVRCANKASAE